jgi:hypothetical protein
MPISPFVNLPPFRGLSPELRDSQGDRVIQNGFGAGTFIDQSLKGTGPLGITLETTRSTIAFGVNQDQFSFTDENNLKWTQATIFGGYSGALPQEAFFTTKKIPVFRKQGKLKGQVKKFIETVKPVPAKAFKATQQRLGIPDPVRSGALITLSDPRNIDVAGYKPGDPPVSTM